MRVSGYTTSTDFPTLNALQPAFAGGASDGFFATFDAAGARTQSTYIGGSSDDVATGIAFDAAANMFLVGATASADFPVVNAMDATLAGFDGFVVKVNPAGTALLFATFLGGTDVDQALAVAVDPPAGRWSPGSRSPRTTPRPVRCKRRPRAAWTGSSPGSRPMVPRSRSPLSSAAAAWTFPPASRSTARAACI